MAGTGHWTMRSGTRDRSRAAGAAGAVASCVLAGLLCTAAAGGTPASASSRLPAPAVPGTDGGPDWQELFRLWSGTAGTAPTGAPAAGSGGSGGSGAARRTAAGTGTADTTGADVLGASGTATGPAPGTSPDTRSASGERRTGALRVRGTCPPSDGVAVTTTPATRARTVALTLDDGPSASTPAVLDVLRRKGVHATFFVVGERAERDRGTIARIAAEGHIVANHTWDHPVRSRSLPRGLDSLDSVALAQEIDRQSALVESITGRRVCFLRGPQGNDDSPRVRAAARQRNLTVVDWSVTAKDYLQPVTLDESWVARITAREIDQGPHPILLLHDGGKPRPNTVAALERIITWYRSNGYAFTDPLGRDFPAS